MNSKINTSKTLHLWTEYVKMSTYKTVENITNIGYEYIKYPDGSEEWFLEDTKLEPHQIETMKHLLTCDISELPLYINTELKPVVEWRLKQNDHDRTQNPNQVPG